MIFVCSNHVTDGVKEISAPHIEKIPTDKENCCEYCKQKAVYRLFYYSKLLVGSK